MSVRMPRLCHPRHHKREGTATSVVGRLRIISPGWKSAEFEPGGPRCSSLGWKSEQFQPVLKRYLISGELESHSQCVVGGGDAVGEEEGEFAVLFDLVREVCQICLAGTDTAGDIEGFIK